MSDLYGMDYQGGMDRPPLVPAAASTASAASGSTTAGSLASGSRAVASVNVNVNATQLAARSSASDLSSLTSSVAPPLTKKRKATSAVKKPREKKPLPPQLLAFRFEHRHKLLFSQELNERDQENPGPHQVAKCLETNGNHENLPESSQRLIVPDHPTAGVIRWDLAKLSSDQIRQMTANFGVKKHGSASNFLC